MRVWVLEMCWDYEGCNCVGVFSTKEAAEEAKERLDKCDTAPITEFEVDVLDTMAT